MMLQVGTIYVMKNGEWCTITSYDRGDETSPATFYGHVGDDTVVDYPWRPDGMSWHKPEYTIVAVVQNSPGGTQT